MADLESKWTAKLEAFGPELVRAYLAANNEYPMSKARIRFCAVKDDGSEVEHSMPTRQFVEAWLGAKTAEASRRAETQHKLVWWTFWAAIGALIAAVVGILVSLF